MKRVAAMLERRQHFRSRTLLGGSLAYNKRTSVMSCVVRNITPAGAKISLDHVAVLPDEFDFSLPRRAEQRRARIVWRKADCAGLVFVDGASSAEIASFESLNGVNPPAPEDGPPRQDLDHPARP
jgi:hypothetical protein